MKKVLFIGIVTLFTAAISFGQIRPVDNEPNVRTAPAPASFEAKYEGGMFGYSKKEKGTIRFDDVNDRLVFFGQDGKEKFSVPYGAMLVVSPTSQSVTSTTGNVVRNIPLPGAGLGSLIKEKKRYLVIQFNDPDVDVRGVVNFRVEDKETLDLVVPALGEKAKLSQRGDAFYRPKTTKSDN
ncbi:MAG: hypothetical protein ACRD6X_04690 [Pyrinomonadaceae bacterium]